MSHTGAVTIEVLERPMYGEAEAARLLQLSQSTLHYWLEGGDRRSRRYLPVLRPAPTGSKDVTWGEFVEAGLMRQYRRHHRVPMAELRRVIELLREDLGVPHPLAHARPFVGPGRKLLLGVQQDASLPGDYWLVAVAAGQPTLTPPSETFYERVDWSEDLAIGWRPAEDPRSPVRMRPDERFGLPAIGGVRTETVWEHVEADEGFDEIADELELSVEEVRWALAYESSVRSREAG